MTIEETNETSEALAPVSVTMERDVNSLAKGAPSSNTVADASIVKESPNYNLSDWPPVKPLNMHQGSNTKDTSNAPASSGPPPITNKQFSHYNDENGNDDCCCCCPDDSAAQAGVTIGLRAARRY